MDRMVEVLNTSKQAVLCGAFYLWPLNKRRIHREIYLKAKADYPDALILRGNTSSLEQAIPVVESDDLTKLTGIGDGRAAEMNLAGLFTYKDVADWSPERIMNTLSFIRDLEAAQSLIDEAKSLIAELV